MKQRMVARENRKWFLFYPEDKFKSRWDSLMTFCLIFTCMSTPLYISFQENAETMTPWEWINLAVDILFVIDIIVVFLSAFYNDDFQIVDNLKDIARHYLFGWFLIDVLAIMPFDLLSSRSVEGNSGSMN